MNKIFCCILILITQYTLGAKVKVIRVIDGDTFEIETREKVRLIGVNAPEVTDLFGEESKNYLTEIIDNKYVELKTDNFSRDRDQYNRLLRYIVINNIDINKKMISDGYAFAYLKYKFDKSIEYKNAQIKARELSKGIWCNEIKKSTEKLNYEALNINKSIVMPKKAYAVIFLLILLIIIGVYHKFF
jgi:endonuclease YncB( thermonuclease family)